MIVLRVYNPKPIGVLLQRKNKKNNTIAVVIGNREYEQGIPLVHYAINDAKAIKQLLEERYQIPAENIIYKENASKGYLEGIF